MQHTKQQLIYYSDEALSTLVRSIFDRTRKRVYGVGMAERQYPGRLPSLMLRRELTEYADSRILKEIFHSETYDKETVVKHLREYQLRLAGTDTILSTPTSLEDSDVNSHEDGKSRSANPHELAHLSAEHS